MQTHNQPCKDISRKITKEIESEKIVKIFAGKGLEFNNSLNI